MNLHKIKARFDLAKTERRRLEPIYDDAIRLTMPMRKRFMATPTDTAEDIFDETGTNAVAEFVSRMQSGMIPPWTEFLRLECSKRVDKADREAINRDLAEISEFAFDEIWNSNFAQESAEAFFDLAISTGSLLVEDRGGDDWLHHRAVSITDLFIERGADDKIGGQFREMKRRAGMIPEIYPRMDPAQAPQLARMAISEADKEVTVIDYTRRDYSANSETYIYLVYSPDTNEVIEQRVLKGAGSSPFTTFRWSAAAGETWGRGPLLNGLAAIRTTNLMVELVLENAAMAIVGIYQTDNDGVVNADNIQLLPGTIINKEIGTRGLEPVQGNAGNFNMRDMVLNDQRLNIKRALFNDMLSDPNKTPATAYEVAERMADLANRTTSGFARAHFEFVVPYMRRVLYLLEKRGDIEMPKFKGRAVNFRATSPLAQAQFGRDVQKIMQDYQVRAAIFGPQVASAMYELKELHPWLQERMWLDPSLYKSTDDIATYMQKAAAAMQSAQQGAAPAAQPQQVQAAPAPQTATPQGA